MADYYNTTRGPLSVTLNDGSSMAIPPKGWIFVDPANEGSASIAKLCSKGFLVRSAVARSEPVAVVVPVVAVPVVPEVKVEPVPAPAPSAPAATSSMKEEIVRKKR